MEKAGTNVEKVEIILLKELNLFVKKDKKTARVFYICIKHHSSARNRNLDFTSARKSLPVIGQLLIIRTISCGRSSR